jgi:hypothetical protein
MEECGAFKSVYIMTENMCVAYSLILHASLVQIHHNHAWVIMTLVCIASVYQEQKYHL